MRVKEWQGDVVFLHEVAPGAADRSYGIHVAKLAGLPQAVIARAEQVLATLEKGEQRGQLTRLAEDLPLFTSSPPPRRACAFGAGEAPGRVASGRAFAQGSARIPLSDQELGREARLNRPSDSMIPPV